MKKIFASFLTVLTLLGTTPVFALNEESNTQIVERFEDGSYIEVTIEEIPTLTRSNTKKGNKTTYYKNTYDVILWSVKTSGTFTYNGSTATSYNGLGIFLQTINETLNLTCSPSGTLS